MTENTIKTEELEASSKKPTAKKTIAKVAADKAPKKVSAKAEPKVAKAKADKAPKAAKTVKSSASGKIKITLVKSLIGRLEAHKGSARGLGLSKIRQTVEVADTVENRGMINAIGFLLKCEG